MEESSNVKKVGSASGKPNMPNMPSMAELSKKNVGRADKNIRLGAGGALLLVGIFGSKFWLLIGAYLLATMYFGACPIYSVLNHDTLK